MRVLGGRIVLVEGGASRETQSGGEALLNVARVIRQTCSLTILTIDRDYPPDCTHLSKWRPASRTAVAAAVPRVVLDFTWAVHHQRLSGRRGSGEVSSRARGTKEQKPPFSVFFLCQCAMGPF